MVRSEREAGAEHAALTGASSSFHFRPPRVGADMLGSDMVCRFRYEGREIGPMPVADASSTGVGVTPQSGMDLAPGSNVEVELLDHGVPVWKGRAAVVYQAGGPYPRLGLRFSSGLFDVQRLQLRHVLIDDQLEQELRIHREQTRAIPAEWRAGVGDVAQLLQTARALFDRLDASAERGTPSLTRADEADLLEAAFERWGPVYHAQLAHMYELSRSLPPEAIVPAKRYAVEQLLPLLRPCPMHSRAHDKPRGYAGDYLLMTLYFSPEYVGPSAYARFLHCVAQRYTLSRSVRAREQSLRDAIRAAVARREPARIVALASGPAMEIRQFLEREPALAAPVEFVLIDQDEEALAYSHAQLTGLIAQRRPTAPVHCDYLHFSVRQLLEPRSDAEREAGDAALRGASLVYSAGLFDYLPARIARALVQHLVQRVRPGGRVLISNLSVAPDTTWLMDYVLAWHLVYRTRESMRALAEGVEPAPARVAVGTDTTGCCQFLDITRAA